MSIDEKYFATDKNYLLKTVQAFSREMLLDIWTKNAFSGYMVMENPMGLEDDFTRNLKEEISNGKEILHQGYDLLAAIYRYKFGDNQLAFLWDGRTHMEFYDEIWKETFQDWTLSLSRKPEVYRAVIKASMAGYGTNVDFLENSIKRCILKSFNVRLSRKRTILAKSA